MMVMLSIILTGVSAYLYAIKPEPLQFACLFVCVSCLIWTISTSARHL